MTRRTARLIITAFEAWRERRRAKRVAADLARRIAAANPEMAKLQQQIAERAKRHGKIEPLRKQLQDHVVMNLCREQGRTLPERKAS